MLKTIAAAAALLIVATNAHADNPCVTSCEQECLRTGSLARECQIECTQECPVETAPPTCTLVTDSSAHDACIANDTAWYFTCLGLFPIWGIGPAWCSSQLQKAVSSCPATVQVCK
ncbi:MAG TPA: hypothetical protein VFQ65_25245 [Kofleriaceae bacterium]|nr:hypothetical protein [Kofleriaceae bacterium]